MAASVHERLISIKKITIKYIRLDKENRADVDNMEAVDSLAFRLNARNTSVFLQDTTSDFQADNHFPMYIIELHIGLIMH